MKKIIALSLLLMFLISSVCMASPYVAYADTEKTLLAFDFEKAEQALKQKNEERIRQVQQDQGLGIDFEKLDRELKEENRQRYSGLNQYQQTKEQEQEIAIRVEQARQERQKMFLLFGMATVIVIACLYLKRKTIHQWLSAHIAARKISSLQISQIFLILFLLIVTTDRFSSGIYTLLRILTTTISVWSATRTENNILRLIFAFIAILFNPIVLVELGRDEWQVIDVATAIFYLGIVIRSITRK